MMVLNLMTVMTIVLIYVCFQISQLMQFAEALLEYHKQCSEILQVGSSENYIHAVLYKN